MYREHQQLRPARNLFCYFRVGWVLWVLFVSILSFYCILLGVISVYYTSTACMCVVASQLCSCASVVFDSGVANWQHVGIVAPVCPLVFSMVSLEAAHRPGSVCWWVCACLCVFNLFRWASPRNCMYLNLNIFIAIIRNIAKARFVLMVHTPLNCVWTKAFPDV